MTVQPMAPSQIRPIEEHLDRAAVMSDDEVAVLGRLAEQLQGQAVMPLLGAGASFDCGMKMAAEIGEELLGEYERDPDCRPHHENLGPDLGDVADAIYARRGGDAVLAAMGMDDPTLWPGSDGVGDHFCALRVLARIVREEHGFQHAFSFNYDCCGEAALDAEGFIRSNGTMVGQGWIDHARVICSQAMNDLTLPRTRFELFKGHGCVEHYRERRGDDGSVEDIIIRTSQIRGWGQRSWAKDSFRERARRSILLLIGFSGQPPVIAEELKDVLGDVYDGMQVPALPRVVVLDHRPNTVPLDELIALGAGPDGPSEGVVTRFRTDPHGTTAVLMVLLSELVAARLKPSLEAVGMDLPETNRQRLGLTLLGAPAMLRWSFLLGRPDPRRDLAQEVNVEMREGSYVPLSHDPTIAVAAIKARSQLRAALGLGPEEDLSQLLGGGGFLLTTTMAYMPLGISFEEVEAAYGDGSLDQARNLLPWPDDLECVLVCEANGGRRGFSLERCREVSVP